MESSEPASSLSDDVRIFAADWVNLSESDRAERLVADPILVLGEAGTVALPRAVFLQHVGQRLAATSGTHTDLADVTVRALGDVMVVATVAWRFVSGESITALVSDFLLQRTANGLQCVAYLPRTNVMNHAQPPS